MDFPSNARSLKVKAITFIALIILAVGGFLSWRFLDQAEEILTTELQSRALAFSNNLARSSKYGVLTEDPEILREVADGALQEEGVVYVRITNAQGKVLAEQLKDPSESNSFADGFRRITTVDPAWDKPFITYHVLNGVGIYHTFAQVQTLRSATASRLSSELMLLGESSSSAELNEPKVVRHGDVQILLSSEKVIDKIRNTLFGGILLTLVIVGIAQLISFFGVDYIVNPLRAMAQGALNISRGDLSQRVPVRSKDEIGVLATAFNHMTESLSTMTHAQQRRLAELSTLHDIGIVMSSTLDQKRLVDLTLQAVVGRLSYDRGMFFRYDDEKRALVDGRFAGASKALDATLSELEIPLDEKHGLLATVALNGESVLSEEAGAATLAIERPMSHLCGSRSFLAAPVKFEGRTLGIVVVESLGKPLTAADLSLVATLCSQLAVAMANAAGYRQIEQLNVNLEQKVAERTAELQLQQDQLKEVNERLRQATRHKSEFLARMSHELRTPLNAIIGYSEMLIEEHESPADKPLTEDLKKIHSSGNHLLSLINDILDLSKVEAGKMERYIESVDVATLVNDVQATVRPLVEKGGNAFSVVCPANIAPIRTDITKLRQILLNLLSNAGKFTNRGTVSLTVGEASKAGKRWLSFVVKDSGIGISAQQMKNLFQEFAQADVSTSRRYGGTGLGLAICKRYSEMMGGHIDAESTLGQGTTLTVWLPADTPDAISRTQNDAAVAATKEGDEPTDKRTVLVIDDDASTREIISRFLSKDGFRTVLASNGESGLKLAKELHPTAITLDVMMPGVDGWTVLAQLKADPELADIPVIVVSILDEKDMGYSLGAADYMAKPIDRERLLAIVRKHCRDSAHGRVLVVDDDDNARTMIGRMVAKDGWTVIEANNGRVALDILAKQPLPAIILLDLIMPVMDGLQFINEVRKHTQWRTIPIVVLTAKDLSKDERLRLNQDVQQILEKSTLSREALLRELTSSIERAREAVLRA
ncbi:MAG TPA: response regulator [Casimicrobiaceae bacterium]|nr:response regulator [Casimicrobiaceae bacterium]